MQRLSRRRTALVVGLCGLVSTVLVVTQILAATPSARAATPASTTAFPNVVQSEVYFVYDGLERSYTLLHPKSAAGPLPLLVILHGTGATTAIELARTDFEPEVEAGLIDLVLPESFGDAWNSQAGCCDLAASFGVDDIGFVAAVVANVSARLPIQADHRWLLGFSGGGKLAYSVACDNPGLFSALAVEAAGPQETCNNPIPLFYGVGDKDPQEPIRGRPTDTGGVHPPAAVTVATYRALDACTGPPQVQTIGTPGKSGTATIDAYACSHGAIEYVTWAGLAHTWPGVGVVSPAVSGEQLMWSFFTSVG